MSEREELDGLLAAAGVAEAYRERLSAFGASLLEANRRFNLTGAKSPAALAPHILDALTLLPEIEGRTLDVGSGGGFPGIPLLLAGATVDFLESNAKKCGFLREQIAAFGLEAEVYCGRAEVLGHDPRLRERYDRAVARALSSATTVAEYLIPFLRVGGVALMPRGRAEEGEEAAIADASLVLGAEPLEDIRLEGERRIVRLIKRKPTSDRFPRRTGIPESKPLCR
ncbi:MAG: 16S rRNA (guanine(527)-N(7))-methyltransferase RsmG [Candidatus Eremiobacteraeota bacterium]|nr:16S rRNA (guanine(527)-N(7))-methyltransferase RsmG [Candidatus Eremiobacteraeota bacterium]